MENTGSQNRAFHYKQPLTSSEFNRVFSKTLPPGIYEGGNLTRVSNNVLSIDPIAVVIEDEDILTTDIAVRIRTLSAVNFDIESDSNRPLIAVRFKWNNSETDYLEFAQVSEIVDDNQVTSLHTHDLVIGKVVFSGNKIAETNSFDYTRSDKSFANPQSSFLLPLLVVKTPLGTGNSKKVYVDSGQVLSTTGLVELVGQYSPSISDTTTLSRWDYIYLDDLGTIKVQEGSESSNPKTKPFYGRNVLAIIKRGAGRTDIKGNDIYSCRSAESSEIKSTSILVKDAGTGEVFAKNSEGFITIDMALRELWNKAVTIEGRATSLENDVVYKATSQAITGEKTYQKMMKFLSSTNATLLPTEESHPITKKYYEDATTGTSAVKVGTAASPLAQTIYGVKTFNNLPKVPSTNAPTDNSEVVCKKHFDDNTVKLGTDEAPSAQTIYGVKTFNSLPKAPETDPTIDAEVITKKFLEGNAKVLRLGTAKNGEIAEVSEAQDIYGVKTFKAFPLIPETDPTKDAQPISKKFLDVNAKILRIGTSATNEAQDIYGVKTFKVLPKFNDGTNPLEPSDNDHPIVKKYYDTNTVKLSGNQPINGTKTFNNSPSIPDTPAANSSAINKSYLAGNDSNVVHRTGNETIGGEKTFSSVVVAPTFNSSSSRALKENIFDYEESALDIVNKTKVVRYSYIDDPDSYLHIGFIAEDTPEIMTGITHKTMALSDVCGVLLKAVQELSAEIKELKEGK